MYKISQTLFFFFAMVFSIFLAASSNNLFSAWVSLELNFLAFLPLMTTDAYDSSESTIKYFLIQAFSGQMFMIGVFSSQAAFLSSILITVSLSFKLGLAPFHFWFVEISKYLSWMSNFMLMTTQKLSPLFLMSISGMHCFMTKVLVIFSLLSAVVSGMEMLSQTNLKKFYAYSSLNHMSWMTASMCFSTICWTKYYVVYVSMVFGLFVTLSTSEINCMNEFFKKKNVVSTMTIIIFMLALAGMPPFSGFVAKVYILYLMSQAGLYTLSSIILAASLLSLYSYLRVVWIFLSLNYVSLYRLCKISMSLSFIIINLIAWILFWFFF